MFKSLDHNGDTIDIAVFSVGHMSKAVILLQIQEVADTPRTP
jgi:hypothetical protein